ncbi:type II toxin-antitoxin system RelE/ParE family toxin [Flavobacterium nackdongense]|uniref:Type II toxin-antitoxin system RelE/ParE family toxin n=1 Tax=Flavobacterium nackdongense TaxID=2547394 RepID=A0A4P6YDQ6_9FLAO|nr:type II toxin-antitoxin system RelE/ParE family toxin [Flavobacterium nackdongense]QBN18827.1 type II toxin-antitoxin system RelE/ParE family toxin [Flavobacterium nackdongense]
MRAKVKYAIFVKEDILESVNWYNCAQKGLGVRFLKEVKEKINYIAENPEAIQVRYQDVQIAVAKTFPYTIHFRFLKDENTIWILGVFHSAINPDKWLKRL